VTLPPFQQVFDEHSRAVYRFLAASVGRDAADDCFQETFLSALRAYPRLRHADNLRGWLLTIAHRKALDHHRARARHAVPVADVPEVAVTDGTGPADAALWELVRSLPAKQRAAVVLHHLLDLPYADVGRVLDSSEEAARRSAFEGLRKLRHACERREAARSDQIAGPDAPRR
jgi:DNA-directed RNA polymerase specialized sigma24 family protein